MTEIVDTKYLMENLKLPKSFIARHARAMGSFCRPQKFFLKNVIAYLEALAEKSIQKSKSHNNKINFKDRINREIKETKMRVEARRIRRS